MTRRLHLGPLVVVAVAGAGACGGGAQTTIVSDAATAMAAHGSFRVTGQSRTFESANPAHVLGTGTTDAVVDIANGRSRFTTRTSQDDGGRTRVEELVRIRIGSDTWIKETAVDQNGNPVPGAGISLAPGRPWIHTKPSSGAAPAASGAADPTGLLDQLKADGNVVRVVNHEQVAGVVTTHYAVQPGSSATTNAFLVATKLDVWIDHDRLPRRARTTTSLRAQPDTTPPTPAETIEETFDLTDFGAHVDIEPPPADLISEVPVTPSCSSQTTESTPTTLGFACLGPRSSTVPDLPAATVGVDSTLQLRPVRDSHPGPCPEPAANPPEAQPATLSGPSGICYDVDPSAATIRRAAAMAEVDPFGKLDVLLSFQPSDAAALDRAAAGAYQSHSRLALVMFGRVLSAPLIQQPSFNGNAAIQPVDPQTAANVIASLSP